jgi:hypothetical protein
VVLIPSVTKAIAIFRQDQRLTTAQEVLSLLSAVRWKAGRDHLSYQVPGSHDIATP